MEFYGPLKKMGSQSL